MLTSINATISVFEKVFLKKSVISGFRDCKPCVCNSLAVTDEAVTALLQLVTVLRGSKRLLRRLRKHPLGLTGRGFHNLVTCRVRS